jgi:hypothetical protein
MYELREWIRINVSASSFDACLSYTRGSTPYSTSSLILVRTLLRGLEGLERHSGKMQFHYTICIGREEKSHIVAVDHVTFTNTLLDTSTVSSSHSWDFVCHSTQTTVTFLAVVDRFLCFVSFGTHDVALFLWPANAENVLLQVGSFESPNCWADPFGAPRISVSQC